MPLAVYVLGLAIFAQGTSELMLAGLLPEMAADLGVSIPHTGLLISAFAGGMLVGAPVLAVVTLRWPRRTALLTFLAIFAAAHVAGALTPNYAVLLATRIVGAFVYAGFWAVAVVTAVGLAGPTARGRAIGIVAGGLTVATVVGLPAGTVVGQHLGWRAAFWAVAVLSALAAVGVITTIPGGRPHPQRTPRLGAEFRALANPQVWLLYATTALATTALIVSFSYLAPMLTETTGLTPGWVPAVLALYGIGAFTGITIGSRTADAHPVRTLQAGVGGLVAVSTLLALATDVPALAVPAILLLGAFGFATNPTLNSRAFALAPEAPTLAAAMNVSAFNVGITAGPWLGGLAIDAGFDYPAIAWIGAALGVATLGLVALSAAADIRVRATA
ncbi:MFS transporter, DHA1 family, chloramphenicol resistance protein [Micromonospora citrea]|uniref:MFS transporter, DHA1 family, chloramphenicol resistance protein n=1 Tax=Micromonospora citrea TaxID=47855 RepID=A0A1C6UUH2_9ACTN|nr:Cmx/CmrA family chloramphenicol efflux MFS transporter [Micromonospora citrea]SCL57660.1 MFS transporter, DHA1 family, chloramphenicol resistance protein [Micromonospora citrea]